MSRDTQTGVFRLLYGSLSFWTPTLLKFVALVLPGKAHLSTGAANNTISGPKVKGLEAADARVLSTNALNYINILIVEICWRCKE
ncbi:MAG: hypothetical protein ACI81O_001052 [Cyclobacteriaceae bacterium]|jgi:hypothetical protein